MPAIEQLTLSGLAMSGPFSRLRGGRATQAQRYVFGFEHGILLVLEARESISTTGYYFVRRSSMAVINYVWLAHRQICLPASSEGLSTRGVMRCRD